MTFPDAVRRDSETGNVHAIRNDKGRAGKNCVVLGRATFDKDRVGATRLCAAGAAKRSGRP
jgi:hypothetical protein